MITRPLELASRLRHEPRNFDAFFYVNLGLIVIFFVLLFSRFVLAPGLGTDFKLPQEAGARANAVGSTCVVSVKSSGQIFTNEGLLSLGQLPEWLKSMANKDKNPELLILASTGVPFSQIADISAMASKAGFVRVQLAEADPGAAPEVP